MEDPSSPESAASAVDAAAPAPPGARFAVESAVVHLPEECAGCGAIPIGAETIGRGERAVTVPYCSRCLRRVAAARTRSLAVITASLVVAAAAAGAGPILWPWGSASLVAGVAVAASLLPLAVDRWLLPRLLPRAAPDRAVYFTARGELACRRAEYAERVAGCDGVRRLDGAPPNEPVGWIAVGGPLLAVVAALSLHRLHHPLVRMVDLLPEPLVIEVDGHVVAEVLGSSVEDPEVGVEVRLPAGRRRLVARSRTGVVDEDTVVVRSGRQHLYAPGPHDRCFWIEVTRYGREGDGHTERTELPRGESFWALPDTVDAWFVPSPPAPEGARSSGGRLTALRLGRCRDLPPPVAR